jgi:hypothetical protein
MSFRGRANGSGLLAGPMTGSARSPESITPALMNMDSGLTASRRPGMTRLSFDAGKIGHGTGRGPDFVEQFQAVFA